MSAEPPAGIQEQGTQRGAADLRNLAAVYRYPGATLVKVRESLRTFRAIQDAAAEHSVVRLANGAYLDYERWRWDLRAAVPRLYHDRWELLEDWGELLDELPPGESPLR